MTSQPKPELLKMCFVDIETVPQLDKLDGSTPEYDYYRDRFINQTTDIDIHEHYSDNAALYAEHGKIVAISLGKMHEKRVNPEDPQSPVENKFYVKTFVGKNEKALLETAFSSLQRSQATMLCGHNGKEFDFPYLFRRAVINDLPVPEVLNCIGKKPWEVNLFDTMEMWGHIQWRYRCSLNLLTQILGLPSPKLDMTGSEVAATYYAAVGDMEKELLEKIGKYCSGDNLSCANVYCKLKGLPTIDQAIVIEETQVV